MARIRQSKRHLSIRWVWVLVVGAIALGGCGGASKPSSEPPSQPSSASSTTAAPKATVDVGSAGDIPDNQAFVVFDAAGARYRIKTPEGWAQSTANDITTFTDKLNSIRLQTMSLVTAPTTSSVSNDELRSIAGAGGYTAGKVSTVSTTAGRVVKATYRVNSSPDSVTGKVVQDDVERYSFWKDGTEVVVTLSSPHGADNGDPWRTVVDSFQWK